MEVSMTWQLPGGAIVGLTFAGDAALPTVEQFDALRAYIDVWSGTAGRTSQQLAELQQGVVSMSVNLDALKGSIAALQADVAEQNTVTASVLALVDGLKAQIADALASDLALPELTAQLEAMNAELDSARAQLADAVVANTPAAPPVIDPPIPA